MLTGYLSERNWINNHPDYYDNEQHQKLVIKNIEGRYMVGSSKVCVVAAIIEVDGGYLMQDHVKTGCWTIPVGSVEEGETPLEALARELYEELGVDDFELLEVNENHVSRFVDTEYIYRVKLNCGWYNREKEKHRDICPMTLDAITKIDNLTEVTKNAFGLVEV